MQNLQNPMMVEKNHLGAEINNFLLNQNYTYNKNLRATPSYIPYGVQGDKVFTITK